MDIVPTVTTVLNDHQEVLIRTLERHQQTLDSCLNRHQKQIVQKLDNQYEHQMTREIINTQFRDLQSSLSGRPIPTRNKGREIHFFGARSNLIMAYLLPLKGYLEPAIERLLIHHNEDVSPQHTLWFRSEFHHLLASAAQEEAARYKESTASSIDRWQYSEDTFYSLDNFEAQKIGPVQKGTGPEKGSNQISLLLKPRMKFKQYSRAFLFDLPSGQLELTLLKRASHARLAGQNQEARLSFTSSASEYFAAIDICFTTALIGDIGPQLCTQLNVFTRAQSGIADIDGWRLLLDGTIDDIDKAIRKGYLSPYDIDTAGDLTCIYVSTTFAVI